jgi:hypothetical protein
MTSRNSTVEIYNECADDDFEQVERRLVAEKHPLPV